MLNNYRAYLVVGGMPEAVQTFLSEEGDLARVRQLQTELNGSGKGNAAFRALVTL